MGRKKSKITWLGTKRNVIGAHTRMNNAVVSFALASRAALRETRTAGRDVEPSGQRVLKVDHTIRNILYFDTNLMADEFSMLWLTN